MKNNKKISTRGRTFTGVVVSDKMSKTVTVEWTRRQYIPKYERYQIRRTRVKAHNPEEIDAREGDIVTIKETRPLSKTKHFIVIKKHSKEATEEATEETVKEEKKQKEEKKEKAEKEEKQEKKEKKETTKKEKKTTKKTEQGS